MPPNQKAALNQTKAIVRRSQRQHFAVQKADEVKLFGQYRDAAKTIGARISVFKIESEEEKAAQRQKL